MKIAFYSTISGYPWGGADALWTKAAEHALARESKVLLCLSELTASSRQVANLTRGGASLHTRRRPGPRTVLGRSLERLDGRLRPDLRALDEYGPDLLIVSQGGAFCTIYDEPLFQYLATFGGQVRIIVNAQREDAYLRAHERTRAAELYARADRVFFVSRRNLEVTERALLQRLARAEILHYPVRQPIDDEFSWPNGDALRMATVSRYEAWDKGLDLLLQSLSDSSFRKCNWRVEMFGRGVDEDYLREAIRYYDLSDRVSLRGFVEDLDSVWTGNQMLLLPSRIEGCALAMMEALLRGRPVLATDVAGASEWIKCGITGYLCSAPSTDLLVETLKRAFSEHDRWRELGQNAYLSSHGMYRSDDFRKVIQ